MKKLLLMILMILPLAIVSGCSCHKFDISTYESAVKNFNNSTAFEYELTITTKVDGNDYYTREESKNKYLLTTTGEVYDFSSEMKSYKILTPANSPEGAPSLIYELYRYYVGEENKFYTKEIAENSRELKKVETISYTEKYSDLTSPYNRVNLVPVFTSADLGGFQISNIEGKNGFSTSLFTAPVPSHLQSTDELALYSITMNKDFYFETIEFVVVNGATTTTYQYKFLNFNNDVELVFPAELVSY